MHQGLSLTPAATFAGAMLSAFAAYLALYVTFFGHPEDERRLATFRAASRLAYAAAGTVFVVLRLLALAQGTGPAA